jgi:hypothetical protein
MTTHVSSLADVSPVPLLELNTPLVVVTDSQGMIDNTIAMINAMDSDWHCKQKIKQILKLIELIRNQGMSREKDIIKNIDNLLKMAKMMSGVKAVNSAEIRFQIDELLSIQAFALYRFVL